MIYCYNLLGKYWDKHFAVVLPLSYINSILFHFPILFIHATESINGLGHARPAASFSLIIDRSIAQEFKFGPLRIYLGVVQYKLSSSSTT